MSHGCPAVRRLSRLQPLSVFEGGWPSEAVGKVFRRGRVKKRPRHHRLEGLRGENGRNNKEEKNKQVQTNHDMLQETVYQLCDHGCCKVGTSVFTSTVNTLQYVTYSPNEQSEPNEVQHFSHYALSSQQSGIFKTWDGFWSIHIFSSGKNGTKLFIFTEVKYNKIDKTIK